jgi:two-component system response regulator AgrA
MYEYYGKLDDIRKQLDDRFYRCHRSFIVNVQAVESINKKEHTVYLKGGYKCFVATRRIKSLLQLFNDL